MSEVMKKKKVEINFYIQDLFNLYIHTYIYTYVYICVFFLFLYHIRRVPFFVLFLPILFYCFLCVTSLLGLLLPLDDYEARVKKSRSKLFPNKVLPMHNFFQFTTRIINQPELHVTLLSQNLCTHLYLFVYSIKRDWPLLTYQKHQV